MNAFKTILTPKPGWMGLRAIWVASGKYPYSRHGVWNEMISKNLPIQATLWFYDFDGIKITINISHFKHKEYKKPVTVLKRICHNKCYWCSQYESTEKPQSLVSEWSVWKMAPVSFDDPSSQLSDLETLYMFKTGQWLTLQSLNKHQYL